jgi:hypothetical protein
MSVDKLSVTLPKNQSFSYIGPLKKVIHRYRTEWIPVNEPVCLTPRFSFKTNDFIWPTLSLDVTSISPSIKI